MKVQILTEYFDPWQLVHDYQAQTHLSGYGATTVFVGTMRDFNQGDAVISMQLEHYPQMTQAYLEEVTKRISQKYQLDDVLLIHRIGEIKPNEAIVLVAVWSRYRREAYLANREIMEELKSYAPFWKKEKLAGGEFLTERWVEKNTPS